MKVEGINPYAGDDRAKGSQVEAMFDSIAPAYDFMNRAMTFGIDRLWRRSAVRTVAAATPRTIVDIATGTGDLAIEMARKMPRATILGVDLSQGMLDIGARKVAKAGLDGRISFRQADCLALPLEDNSTDAITAAYGVRNFADIRAGYAEMYRVLRPGGMIAVLELSTPTSPLVRPLYRLYTSTLVPLAGRLVSHDTSAYSYLPASIAAVPQGETMLDILRSVGFRDCKVRTFTFGTCSLYTAYK